MVFYYIIDIRPKIVASDGCLPDDGFRDFLHKTVIFVYLSSYAAGQGKQVLQTVKRLSCQVLPRTLFSGADNALTDRQILKFFEFPMGLQLFPDVLDVLSHESFGFIWLFLGDHSKNFFMGPIKMVLQREVKKIQGTFYQ